MKEAQITISSDSPITIFVSGNVLVVRHRTKSVKPKRNPLGLGSTDQKRLELLLTRPRVFFLKECIELLFPDAPTRKAVADLTKFRKRINDAAKQAKLPFRLCVDSKKRNQPAERLCWSWHQESLKST